MFTRRLVVHAAIVGLCSAALIAQRSRPASSSGVLREFPVVLQQSVEAGKTQVGTKVRGKLAAPIQFHGTLIPRDAVVSGVIFESVRKSAKTASRLGIRMESASWKDSSACMMKAYLMPLYYPLTNHSAQGLPIESPDPESRTLNGPNQSGSSPMSAPSSNNSDAIQAAIPQIATISSRPVSMKNVTIEPVPDDGIALVSQHDNIKLYKMTTYVLAAIEQPAE
jgi:hypothetical protein